MKSKALILALAGLLAGCDEGGEETGPLAEVGIINADASISPYPGLAAIERWRFELFKEDRAFNMRVQMAGADGFAQFFAPDGAMIQPGAGEIRGQETIDSVFRSAIREEGLFSFVWEPDRAEVSNGGDLGYTVGTYRTITQDSTGVRTSVRGKYVSIWRRQEDGTWKVEMDLGNPTSPPETLPSVTPIGAPGGLTP
jgi:ketosteroid isomerase-like protein